MQAANTLMDTELTDAQWQIADAIARQLVLDGVDVNELRKAIAYLRETVGKENAGKNFFNFLKTLVRHGNTIGHSKKTVNYYQSLEDVCDQYLSNYRNDAQRILTLLGWASRLVSYYDKGVPTGEIKIEVIKTEREIVIQNTIRENSFQVGQVLEATVTAIKNNTITYEILETIRLTLKKPKKTRTLSVGERVRVEITQLRENGSLKKVRLTE